MSDKRFAMSVTVEHPRVKYVSRLGTGEMLVSIGNPEKYDHVALVVTDERWRAIVRDVDQQITEHDQKKMDTDNESEAAEK